MVASRWPWLYSTTKSRDQAGYPDPQKVIYQCPDSYIIAQPFQPFPHFCIEGETISLCKTRDPRCYNDGLPAIQDIPIGTTIEFDADVPYVGIIHYSYIRLE